jgi:ribonuclease HII
MKICGIDEAGRGPVIGPLVIAGVSIDESNLETLKKLEPKDSKMLSKKRREELFDQIRAITDYYIVIVEPEEVDAALIAPELNLNKLEGIKMAETINKLHPDKAIVDAPSTNIKEFTEFMRSHLENKDTELLLEHKADENYAVVSAASILAKVTRDREIEKLNKIYGELGSGYPSDPKTRAFLVENWDTYPQIFRKTWATYKKIAITKKQKNLSDY